MTEIQGIGGHREEIDRIDEQIVELLNSRRKQVLAIGAIKHTGHEPVLDFQRESDVIHHVHSANIGPLPDDEIAAFYELILEYSARAQRAHAEYLKHNERQ